jgi:enterochelin esterase-like enzyme
MPLIVWLLLAAARGPAQDAGLRQALAAVEQAIEEADSAAQDREALAYRSNMPLARFKLRKAAALARAPFEGPTSAERALAEARDAIDRLAKGEVAFEGETGHLERAYVTANDNTAQPYYVHVPKDYDPKQQWPLIVFLHGYVPYTSIIDPWLLPEEHEQIAADNDAILLTPYGRRNTDFQGVGEVDVLAAIEETKRFYNIDADRVSLCGPSMGGYGTWTIALRYPGMFAACAPMCGQTDMFVWWPWPYATAPEFKRFLGEWDNPIHLAPNGVGQSFLLQHGELDRKPLIPVEQSHMMRWEMDRLGTPIQYYEHEGSDHFIYHHALGFEKAFSWLVTHRVDRWPKHIRLKSYSYRYDTAFWLSILEYQRWGSPGEVEAQVQDNRIELRTQNVSRVRLSLAPELVDLAEPLTVVADGREVFREVAKGAALDLKLAEPLTPPQPAAVRKRKGLCGPIEDVLNGPFTVVVGTAGSAQETRALMDWAGTWVSEWDAFADGVPPVKLDTDVDGRLMAERNLVLFGTPKTNHVLAEIADGLPIKIEDGRYGLGDRTFEGPDLGVAFCYPNPKRPGRYVLVYAGQDPGRNLGINHKHDLLPDYCIFRAGPQDPHDDTYPYLCAGFFDLNWQFDPELADEEAPAEDRCFGSANTVRDRSLTQPVAAVTNGFADVLRVRIDDEEATLQPGEVLERTLTPGRHRFTALCPDGVTRTEERLTVPEFRYEWRVPALYRAGWP